MLLCTDCLPKVVRTLPEPWGRLWLAQADHSAGARFDAAGFVGFSNWLPKTLASRIFFLPWFRNSMIMEI
jgi:hypothetical protein